MHTEGVPACFSALHFSFVTSSQCSTWAISLFLLFFVSSLMPCFHVTTSFPHPSYASMVEAGVFCCGLGRYRSIWFGSGRYIEQFTDTTTGVCEGLLTLFHGSSFFLLYDSIPSVAGCQKCTNLTGCLLLEMVKVTLGFCCIRSDRSLIVSSLRVNRSEATILSRADICLDGTPSWLGNITAIFALFFCFF